MSPPDDDPAPFTFDEEFIRAAQFKEPSARQRSKPPSPPAGKGPRRKGPRRQQTGNWSRYKPWIPAVAFVVIAGWSVFGLPSPFSGGDKKDKPPEQQDGGPAGAEPTTSSTILLLGTEFRPGDCVSWDQTPGNAERRNARFVPCDNPHLIEITGRADLSHLRDYPSAAEWNEIERNRECRQFGERFLEYPLDPDGKFATSGIHPDPPGWGQGSRWVWCGLSVRASADDPDTYDPFTGKVKGQDQTLLLGTGACLAEDSNQKPAGTVPCTAPHVFEVVGAVNAGNRLTAPPPVTSGEWARILGPDCADQARTYFAGAVPPGLKSNVLPFRPESWNAGRRTAECVVYRPDATGRPVTLTAPLRPGS